MTTNFFLFSLALGVATGALGSYIAEKKRKNPSFWICDRFFYLVLLEFWAYCLWSKNLKRKILLMFQNKQFQITVPSFALPPKVKG